MAEWCQQEIPAPQPTASLFDNLVGGIKQRWGHGKAQRLCGFEVDNEIEFVGGFAPEGQRAWRLVAVAAWNSVCDYGHSIEVATACCRSFCEAAILKGSCPKRVNCPHYRAAALLSALPQLAESIRAAKRFRVVP
jgi:hypothetical protein